MEAMFAPPGVAQMMRWASLNESDEKVDVSATTGGFKVGATTLLLPANHPRPAATIFTLLKGGSEATRLAA